MKLTKEEKEQKDIEQWKAFKENFEWSPLPWRAWGSWFSWGSPVGLGLFFVLTTIAAAILIWVIKL